MKSFLIFLLCALPAALVGQTSLKTFTSTDHAFQFHYPSLLARCTRVKDERPYPSSWTPRSCSSELCDDLSTPGSHTVACFAYPGATLHEPTFQGAAFAAAKFNSAKTEKDCLAAPPGSIPPQKTGNIVRINGTQFLVFDTEDAGMSHYLEGHIYRAFHRNNCYQLSIRIATVSGSVLAQPIPDFSAQSEAKVMRQLNQALDSFQFLK